MKTSAQPPDRDTHEALRRLWRPHYLSGELVWVETADGILLRPGSSNAAVFFTLDAPNPCLVRQGPESFEVALDAEEATLVFARSSTPAVTLGWATGDAERPRALSHSEIVPLRELASEPGAWIAISKSPDFNVSAGWEVARVIGPLEVGPEGSLAQWLYRFFVAVCCTDFPPLCAWEGRWPVFAAHP